MSRRAMLPGQQLQKDGQQLPLRAPWLGTTLVNVAPEDHPLLARLQNRSYVYACMRV